MDLLFRAPREDEAASLVTPPSWCVCVWSRGRSQLLPTMAKAFFFFYTFLISHSVDFSISVYV